MNKKLIGWGVGALLVVGGIGAALDGEEPAPAPRASASTSSTTTVPVTPSVPTSKSTPSVKEDTATVIHVVDGDTIKLDDGRTVRLIGVDTPEKGQCGYLEAIKVTAFYVDGIEVSLVKSKAGKTADRDKYGRYLRYVRTPSFDVGMELIKKGRAKPRYNSTDGYGRHDLETAYQTAYESAKNANVCATPSPVKPKPTSNPAIGTDTQYNTCREVKEHGLGPYYKGKDPEYSWYKDRDGDGVVCE